VSGSYFGAREGLHLLAGFESGRVIGCFTSLLSQDETASGMEIPFWGQLELA
jgi:hypothetical protein